MTGTLLAYKLEKADDPKLSKKIRCLYEFSLNLSQISGIDFAKVLSDHNEELKGLITYMNNRMNELKEEGLSSDNIYIFITLNLISSLSLWFGFDKAKGSYDTRTRHTKKTIDAPSTYNGFNSVSSFNYKVGIVIPTNMAKADHKRMTNFEKLVASISSWRLLAGVWIIGTIPDRLLTRLTKLKNVDAINMESNSGPARARNIGIERALNSGSDLVVFMDDDVVDPINETFKSLCDEAVLGNDIYTPKIESYGDTCYDLFHDIDGTLNGVYEPDEDRKSLVYCTTCVMVCSGRLLHQGLRFDEEFPLAAGEDIDFCFRARNMGYKIIPKDSVIVKHDYGYDGTDNSLMKFIYRFIRYGEGNSIIRERQPEYFNSLTNAVRRQTDLKKDKRIKIPDVINLLSNKLRECMQ